MDDAPRWTPVALTIAGSDCSGGAGIQADLKTFAAHGVYGLSAVTCLVAEIPGRVVSIHEAPEAMLKDQMEVLLEAYPIEAIKTGMLYTPRQIQLVADLLGPYLRGNPHVSLVVDPVMVATSGDSLMQTEAREALMNRLLPLADLMTPNLDEVEALTGRKVRGVDDMAPAARELASRFQASVLVKGGHLEGARVVDALAHDGAVSSFEAERVPDVSPHGAGCTFSAAIAAGLAKGYAMPDAVASAKEFITSAIAQSHRWDALQALRLER